MQLKVFENIILDWIYKKVRTLLYPPGAMSILNLNALPLTSKNLNKFQYHFSPYSSFRIRKNNVQKVNL